MVAQEELQELRKGLHTEADYKAANKLLCPPHPSYRGVKLRVGIDKRGRWWLFEPVNGRSGPDGWRMYKLCSNTLQAKILPYDDRAELAYRQGPAGCMLIHYEPNPAN